MKKIVIAILLFSALSLFSCDTVDKGDSEPGKTAVLFSSLAEIWLEAGGEIDITVGETVERGFAPRDTLLVDEGAGKAVNTELLLSYKPRTVICSSDIAAQRELVPLLEEAGIRVVSLHIESFDDYLKALDIMTDITGNKAPYENALKGIAKDISDLKNSDKIKEIKGTRILFVRAGSTASSTKSKSSEDHFAAAMLTELGCINIADSATVLGAELSMESILAEDPEYIFFSLMGDEDAARANIESLLSSEAWASLSAVKEGKALILPKELFHFKPCSRWAEAYEYLAEALIKGISHE